MTYILQHIDIRYEIVSLERTEVPQYPETALREAVVNAVMHRDYSDASGDVMVEIFRDRITVSNPGGLVSWLRREDFGKYSRTRNRVIASLLMRTLYVEKMGTGILRINRALAEAGLAPAEFQFDEYNFSVTLAAGPQKTSQKTSQKILAAMAENPSVTIAELADMCEVSTRAIQYHIKALQAKGQIGRIGPDKGGHWKVV